MLSPGLQLRDMKVCECGREYWPKQSWIHEPSCRYLAGVDGRPEVVPNHVPPWGRGYADEASRQRARQGVPVAKAVEAAAEGVPVSVSVSSEALEVYRPAAEGDINTVNKANEMPAEAPDLTVQSDDPPADRRAYMREYMRRKRQKERDTPEPDGEQG